MNIEQEIREIKERNVRVEAEKAWEVSFVRRVSIAAGTYLIAAAWLYIIENTQPLLNAFVPAGGYILSTLTLPIIKKLWLSAKK